MTRRLLLLALVILAGPPALAAQTIVSAPPGWTMETRAGGVVVFTPPTLQAGEVYKVAVFPAAPLDDKALEDWLRAFAGPTGKEPGKLAAPLQITTAAASKMVTGQGVYHGPGKTTLSAQFLGISLDNGASVHVLRVLYSNGDLLKRYQAERTSLLRAMVERARQKKAPAVAAVVARSSSGGLKPSQLAGVYAAQVHQSGVGGFVYVAHEPVLALKDGTFYEGFNVPLSQFDVADSRRRHPKSWSKWRGSGKNIQTLSNKGEWEEAVWIGPLGGGGRLEGTFTSIGGGGNTAYGGSVVVAVIKSFTFFPDGRFQAGSAASALAGGASASSNRRDAGTYKVDGHTLTLVFGDGRVERRSFARMTNKLIYLNGVSYLDRAKD